MTIHALLNKPLQRSVRDVHLEDQAQAELRALPYGALRRTVCRVLNNRLIISGIVPTFHLKQIAQEQVRKCVGSEVLISNDLLVQPEALRIHPGSVH